MEENCFKCFQWTWWCSVELCYKFNDFSKIDNDEDADADAALKPQKKTFKVSNGKDECFYIAVSKPYVLFILCIPL